MISARPEVFHLKDLLCHSVKKQGAALLLLHPLPCLLLHPLGPLHKEIWMSLKVKRLQFSIICFSFSFYIFNRSRSALEYGAALMSTCSKANQTKLDKIQKQCITPNQWRDEIGTNCSMRDPRKH